jgi:hypothetical protein
VVPSVLPELGYGIMATLFNPACSQKHKLTVTDTFVPVGCALISEHFGINESDRYMISNLSMFMYSD